MECKKALQEAAGDEEAAIELLRKAGKAKMVKRADRSTSEGRIAVCVDNEKQVSAIVELLCESASVASHEEFIALADDIAKCLVDGPGAATVEELLTQTSPSKGTTLQLQFDDLNNRIREVFKLNRFERVEGVCGAYLHHNAAAAALLQIEGENTDLAKDICMHTVAMRPEATKPEDLPADVVEKEKALLTETTRAEGKPEQIIDKIVTGRMNSFFAEKCLIKQPFVKDDSKTVEQAAEEGGIKLIKMFHWEMKEA